MGLSTDLISQFVKMTNDTEKKKSDVTIYGTLHYTKEDNNAPGGKVYYVRFDGAKDNQLTPVTSTTEFNVPEDLEEGEKPRVMVTIKNHGATITGSTTTPTVNKIYVDSETASTITIFENLLADKATVTQLNAVVADIDVLEADNVDIKERLTATEGKIDTLEVDALTVDKADARYIKVGSLEGGVVTADDIIAINARIDTLDADKATLTDLDAVIADVEDLDAKKLSAETAAITYANIDFSNIGDAAIRKILADTGLIENIVIGDGTITGTLVGVTITGDLIKGNTVVADKLVIRGTNGLYYKLNTDGMKPEEDQTIYNSLDGTVIMAKSVTASKISVDDLVAFDATIGGFNISESSIYSGVKESVDNTTTGVYLDRDGQMAVGDGSNYLKYYKDQNGNYRLVIAASSILFGANNENVEEAITNMQDNLDATDAKADEAQSLSKELASNIAMLVTDGNGTSLMTQTEGGWTFSTSEIQSTVDHVSENLNTLQNELGDTSNTVDILKQAMADLGVLAEYIKITTYEDEPCIELGEGDSDFKLLITNTRIMFMEGTGVPAYFNNQSMFIKKAVIEEELQQGKFVWKARSNGNMGLIWKGGNS